MSDRDSRWRLTAEELDAICDRLAKTPRKKDLEDLICHLGEVQIDNALLRAQIENMIENSKIAEGTLRSAEQYVVEIDNELRSLKKSLYTPSKALRDCLVLALANVRAVALHNTPETQQILALEILARKERA